MLNEYGRCSLSFSNILSLKFILVRILKLRRIKPFVVFGDTCITHTVLILPQFSHTGFVTMFLPCSQGLIRKLNEMYL